MINFTVQGKPQPKERPRKNKQGGFYTPQKTKDYESIVGWSARSVYKGEPSKNEMFVLINIYFKLPKKTKHKEGDWCMKNTDVDNIAKSVLDGLNGIVWVDDKQVVKLVVKKKWSNYELIEVEIIEG